MRFLLFLLIIVIFSSYVLAAPFFINVPSGTQKVTQEYPYSFDVNASGEGTDLLYDLIFPGGTDYFAIGSSNGIINYNPENENPFNVIIILINLTDFSINSTALSFVVNRLPQFTNLEDKVAINDTGFSYTIIASDADADSLIFSSDNPLIPITTIFPTSGEISLTQAELNSLITLGENPISTNITINDNANSTGFPIDGITKKLFTLNINDPISFNPLAESVAVEDQLFALNISSYVINKIGTITYAANFSFININSLGIMSFIPSHNEVLNSLNNEENKTYNVNISVIDQYGSSASQKWILNITRVNDIPVCDQIDNKVAVVGTNFVFDYGNNATDEEGAVTFFDNVAFFNINETTGSIDFLVNETMVGIHNTIITVNDTENAQCSEQFQLTLVGNNAPRFPKNRSLNVNPIEDLYVDSDFPNINFPDQKFIQISGGNTIRRGYFQFNLANLGNPAALIAAILKLTILNSSGSFDVSVHNLSVSNFSNITFNNAGETGLYEVLASSSGITNSTDMFDVSNIVKECLEDTTIERFLAINLSMRVL